MKKRFLHAIILSALLLLLPACTDSDGGRNSDGAQTSVTSQTSDFVSSDTDSIPVNEVKDIDLSNYAMSGQKQLYALSDEIAADGYHLINASFYDDNSLLLIYCDDAGNGKITVFSLSDATRKDVWQGKFSDDNGSNMNFATTKILSSSPLIFFDQTTGNIYCLDDASGKLSCYALNTESGVAVYDKSSNKIFYTSNNMLYSADAATGNKENLPLSMYYQDVQIYGMSDAHTIYAGATDALLQKKVAFYYDLNSRTVTAQYDASVLETRFSYCPSGTAYVQEKDGIIQSVGCYRGENAVCAKPKGIAGDNNYTICGDSVLSIDYKDMKTLQLSAMNLFTGDLYSTSFLNKAFTGQPSGSADMPLQLLSSDAYSETQNLYLLCVPDEIYIKQLILWKPDAANEQAELTAESKPIKELSISTEKTYGEVTEYANELEQKYNVEIVLGKNTAGLKSSYDYAICENKAVIMKALKTMDKAMAKYPQNFFAQFRENSNGVVLILTGGEFKANFINIGEAGAYSEQSNGCYKAVFNANYYDEKEYALLSIQFYHEISHLIDYHLMEKKLFDADEWEALNPDGFEYYNRYGQDENNQNTPYCMFYDKNKNVYFYLTYAKTNIYEDRATLMELMMSGDDISSYPHLKEKAALFSSVIRKGFDTTGWGKTTWESWK
ncbi:MAG: hypothetical protein QM689_01695 [Oscillospiraceae bacterium]